MKLKKLKLENWRGVAAREIEFSDGVTLVEGPNEIGKSTIIEALQNLFTVMDSSNRADIKAIQPVGRDVGSSVELEAQAGNYHFIYAKTYNRNKQTQLRVLAPQPQQLTGREAHERVQSLLEETVDMTLWNALLVEQGSEIGGVQLAASDGLARALDEAAGGSLPDAEDSDLFARVQAEYDRYFTKSGKAKTWQADLETRMQAAVERESAATDALRQIQQDSDNHERARLQIVRLQALLPELQEELEQHQSTWEAINKLREAQADKQNALNAAMELLDVAAASQQRRVTLRDQLAERSAKLDALTQSLTPQRERLQALDKTSAATRQTLETTRTQLMTARKLLDQRREETQHLQRVDQLSALQRRVSQLAELTTTVASLREGVTNIRINADGLAALRDAERAVEVARARLDSTASKIEIAAENRLDLRINDESLTLAAGAVEQRSIASATKIVLPGLASITVAPSASAAELEAELSARQAALMRLLGEFGVTGLADAVAQDERRRNAEREIDSCNRRMTELAEADSLEILQSRIHQLRTITEQYLAARTVIEPLPESVPGAEQLAAQALSAVQRHQERVDELQQRWETAGEEIADSRGQLHIAEQEAAGERRIVEQLQRELEAARLEASDAELGELVESRMQALRHSQSELDEVTARLESASPEATEQLLMNARESLIRAQEDLSRHNTELAVLKDRLTAAQAEGRFEALEAASGQRTALEEESAAVSARAAAAQRLWEVLNRHRDATRSAYVRPLRESVEQLGKLVFGPDFAVELGDNWELRSRTLNGETISFDDLSIGAKEQLGILLRLAAARIVSSQGGVPLIIDDALGFSDPQRLKTMGAAIASVGRECQVIVLTCAPGRFSHVGNASVINL